MTGKRIAHYEVTDKIGAGGMGEVYRARDTRLGRDVALKVLPEAFAQDTERLARFEREARLLASLNHPNIAAIYGIERDDDRQVLVLELVEGEELSAMIARGPLALDETLHIATQVAEALDTAHEQGVIHRDLKPANIKITPAGTVKVLDFGLAKALETDTRQSDLSHSPTILNSSPTLQGVILGTAAYMSPEQARGKVVDRRADVWAFGCVVYEMLTGRVAFPGETVTDTLAKILEREPDWDGLPESVPPALRYVLEKCLAKDPAERWRSVSDVAMMMRRTAAARGMPETPAPEPARGGNRWLWPVLAGVLAVALGGTLLTRESGNAPIVMRDGAPTMTFDRLTVQGGMETNPCISPDGTFIVYGADEDGDWDVFYQRVPGGRPINLTPNSPAEDGYAAISPDGQRIVFNSDRGEGEFGLYVMGATGESVRRIGDDLTRASWSPDGKHVVASTAGFVTPLSRGVWGDLWILEVDGNERTQLTHDVDAVQPDWSPNGHRVAYWGIQTATGGQRDIWTVGVESGDIVAVTSDDPVDWCPVWSPDGRYLYFVSDRGGSFNLWRMPIDERSGEPTGEPQPMTAPTEHVRAFDVSGDGKRIVYSALSVRSNIFRLDFDLDDKTAPRETQVTRGSTRIAGFDVTEDGEWLVYRSSGHREDLYVARSDGSETRKLTDDPYRDRGPAWSVDGKTIYFYSDRSGRYECWSIRPDGSELKPLTRTGEGESWWFPNPSPDGTRVVAYNASGSIILDATSPPVDPDEGTILPDVSESLVPRLNEWSSDGTRLAGRPITGQENSAPGILIYTLATNSYEIFTDSIDATAFDVQWLSDNRRVAADVGNVLTIVDTETGRVQRVHDFGGSIQWLRIVGDNKAYFRRIESESDIWMATLEKAE
jgi:Tol biopolymer transport system component